MAIFPNTITYNPWNTTTTAATTFDWAYTPPSQTFTLTFTEPEPIMFTKDKNCGVVVGASIMGPYTPAEADSVAAEQAHKTKGSVFIVTVDGVTKPKYDTVTEKWGK